MTLLNRAALVALLMAALLGLAEAQSARRAIGNLMGYTDGSGNLMVTTVAASGSQSARRAIGNLMGRTDDDGNLMVAIDGALAAGQTVGVGTGTATPTVNGTYTTFTTSTQTAANTTETDLWTYNLPANTLTDDGLGVRIIAWGSFGANGNNKTVRVYFGATSLYGADTTTANNVAWRYVATVLRTGASAQLSIIDGMLNSAARGPVITTPASDTTAAIQLKVTGQNGTASAGDIVLRGVMVEAIGNPQ